MSPVVPIVDLAPLNSGRPTRNHAGFSSGSGHALRKPPRVRHADVNPLLDATRGTSPRSPRGACPPRRARRAARSVAAALACLMVAGRPTIAQEIADELRLKAAFVYRFPQFVEWPSAALDGRPTVELCVLAPSPLHRVLERARRWRVARAAHPRGPAGAQTASRCGAATCSSLAGPDAERRAILQPGRAPAGAHGRRRAPLSRRGRHHPADAAGQSPPFRDRRGDRRPRPPPPQRPAPAAGRRRSRRAVMKRWFNRQPVHRKLVLIALAVHDGHGVTVDRRAHGPRPLALSRAPPKSDTTALGRPAGREHRRGRAVRRHLRRARDAVHRARCGRP